MNSELAKMIEASRERMEYYEDKIGKKIKAGLSIRTADSVIELLVRHQRECERFNTLYEVSGRFGIVLPDKAPAAGGE